MQDKTKVTLYLPPDLHRQLKIRAAVESEPMSAIAERAIVFYLTHPGVVDEVEMSHGRTHQVYSCPGCDSPLVLKEGEMVSLKEQPTVLADEELPVAKVGVPASPDQQGEQELVLAN
ncbi:hypothetical protein H6G89_25340 [Oscillatoria sp. FACHB-1407]|uniref:hypothetical protein n=1 Tax=Oscillatoria sp. FACHB-1407 TaxID=2692847 RepID=UPI001688EA8D|nr:hypothetical protein [Oscillatoria sp. FACHB-1407]MBD2464333.1 hypothetical protein [Oscillatoria sp. FACHB-1407]